MLTLVDVTTFHPLVASSLPFILSGRSLFTIFVVHKSNVVGGWCKPIIGHNSNSTLGGVELTWSGDGVGS